MKINKQVVIPVLCGIFSLIAILTIMSLVVGFEKKSGSSATKKSGSSAKKKSDSSATKKSDSSATKKIGDFPGDYPEDGKSFTIQYRNSTKVPITVWLDNQAFCEKSSSSADCKQGDDNAWNKNLGKFFVYTKNSSGKWEYSKTTSARKQDIQPGQIWRIVPPTDSKNQPYWCFDQPAGDGLWQRNCPGVGAWITRTGFKMNAIDKVTRFEYNINNGELWYNSSSVDGVNTNNSIEYSGVCKDNHRVCDIDLDSCPVKENVDGIMTCPSAKWWPDLDSKCPGGELSMGLKPSDVAGCGYGDAARKEVCHKWWASNKTCAQKWLNWLQKNPSGKKCNQYGWAYDEMKYKPGDKFDSNGNPSENHDVRPLVHCSLKGGSLKINITNIL